MRWNYINQHFKKLGKNCGLSDYDRCILKEGYERLKIVRDRDAHSYRECVRSVDFPLLEQKFVPAFNILLKVMRKG